MVHLSFCGRDFVVLGANALFWPERRALLVADLHFEKASSYARAGQMLPPYDSAATLAALEPLVAETGAEALYCLGDSFHDGESPERLPARVRGQLMTLTRRLDWT